MRIFKSGYWGIDPFTLNMYVKAKLKESILRRLALKRWVNIYTKPDGNAVMEIDEWADNKLLLEAIKAANINYYNIKSKGGKARDETRDRRNSKRNKPIRGFGGYTSEKWQNNTNLIMLDLTNQ